MKGKRTDIETKAKVIAQKINNPDLSTRDIEEKTWVGKSTVARFLNADLGQIGTQSERIANLYDRNEILQSLADERIQKALENWEENIRLSELITLRDSTFKQNAVIGLPKKEWDKENKTVIIQI